MPARIQPDRALDTWQELSALWVVLLGATGAGKTPALKLARRPLSRLEDAEAEKHARDLETWGRDRDEAKERKETFSEPPPKLRQISADDTTLEVYLGDLAANDGRLAIIADELRTHLRAMGRYRQRGDGGEHARWVSLWAGDTVQYRRKTGDVRVRISRPAAPVLGGLQTSYLSELGDDEDGSRARWLLHYTPATDIRTTSASEPKDWTEFIETAHYNTAQRTWYLDGAARDAWDIARDEWHALARRADVPPALVQCGRQGCVAEPEGHHELRGDVQTRRRRGRRRDGRHGHSTATPLPQSPNAPPRLRRDAQARGRPWP